GPVGHRLVAHRRSATAEDARQPPAFFALSLATALLVVLDRFTLRPTRSIHDAPAQLAIRMIGQYLPLEPPGPIGRALLNRSVRVVEDGLPLLHSAHVFRLLRQPAVRPIPQRSAVQ